MAESATATRADAGPRGGSASGNGSGPPSTAGRRRRRSVPGGRAVLGGLLVATAAVGLYAASSQGGGGPHQSFVVARHAIPPGTRLGASDLARVPMDLPPTLASRAFRDPQSLVGATVIAPLNENELVQSSAVVSKPSSPPSREVTFPVGRETISASLEEGERVDVVATYGAGADSFTTVVLRQALVVTLDRGRASVGNSGDAVVTVAVDDPNDALALAHAVQLAKLTLVRSTGAAPSFNGPSVYRQPTAAPGR